MTAVLPEIQIADYSEWEPKDYLADYYREIAPDERYAMEFLVESLRRTPEVPVALEFGCGPTLHHALPLAAKAREVHLAEYLAGNRDEVRRWLENSPGAHDWREFSVYTLQLEGVREPTDAEAAARERMVRERVTALTPGDAHDADPLGPARRGFYPLVTSHYCAEGATRDKQAWRRCMRNIAGLVAPGGTFILSACAAADYYCVGGRNFPCAGIDARDVLSCLVDLGFGDIDVRVRQVPDHSEQGFSSVVFARAVLPLSAGVIPPPRDV